MSQKPALNQLLRDGTLIRAMATHSPLSARIAEEAGFDALWASGFELSALYGLPDVSLITMTQHLEMVRAIAGECNLPIVADIDTGFGNAINVIHAVKSYERAGAAAIVIEDKTFPKMTSLVAGGRQELLRSEEFQGKISAAVASRRSAEFLIVARTEALIAQQGEAEAQSRALAYEEAGADMILVHSKSETPDEIESFSRNWCGSAPLVIVPTSYPAMTEARIAKQKAISMVIYGNHAIRACVAAMQTVFAQILQDGGAVAVNPEIAPVAEIFRLQGMDQIRSSEERFLK